MANGQSQRRLSLAAPPFHPDRRHDHTSLPKLLEKLLRQIIPMFRGGRIVLFEQLPSSLDAIQDLRVIESMWLLWSSVKAFNVPLGCGLIG